MARRQAQDLATSLLVLIPASMALLFVRTWMNIPGPQLVTTRTLLLGLAGLLLLEASYYLSRTAHVTLAGGLAVATLEGGVVGFLAAASGHPNQGFVLAVLLVPLTVAVVALPPTYATLLAAVDLLIPAAVSRWGAGVSPDALFGGLAILLPGAGILVALAWSRRGAHAEIKRQAATLRDREGRIQAIYEATPEALVLHREGRVLEANPAFRRMFLIPRGQVEGTAILDLLDDGDRKRIEADPPWGAMGNLEVRARRADGTTFDATLATRPLVQGTTAAWVTAFRDVTQENRSRRTLLDYAGRLRRSNAELASFATVLAHDLQEPVRDIARYGTMLERDLQDELDPDHREHLGFLVEGARRFHDLLADLLVLTEVGRWEGDAPTMDLDDALDRAIGKLDELIRERGATVTRGDLPRVQAQPREMELVLQHLVGNAVKFHGETLPEVRVDAERRNGHWLIKVEDRGPGVEARYRELVFQPFERLQARGESEGTGIGLAICRKVVEHHGGRIWLEEVTGGGSRVCFTLPPAEDDA